MYLNCSFHDQRIALKKCHGRKVFNLQMSLAMVEMSRPLAAVLRQLYFIVYKMCCIGGVVVYGSVIV